MKHYCKRGMDLKKQDLYPKSILSPLIIPSPPFALSPFPHPWNKQNPQPGTWSCGGAGGQQRGSPEGGPGPWARRSLRKDEGQRPRRQGAREPRPGPAPGARRTGQTRSLSGPSWSDPPPAHSLGCSQHRLVPTGHKGCNKPHRGTASPSPGGGGSTLGFEDPVSPRQAPGTVAWGRESGRTNPKDELTFI